MSIPKHYLAGIYKKELLRGQISYEKKFKHQTSQHILDFHKKYNVKISDKTLPKISKITGIPKSVLEKVIKKGRGAYYSCESEPNKIADSWAYARLASFLLGRGAYKIDKHLLNNIDKSKIKIKLPDEDEDEDEECCRVTSVCKTKKKTYNLPRKKCSPRTSCAPFRD